AITPDQPTLQCFRVPLEGGGAAFVLYNDAAAAVTATLSLPGKTTDTVQVALAADSPGLVVVDGAGRLTAVETQGTVTRNGRTLLTAAGHVIVQSLDGKDLADSAQALILPLPGHGAVLPSAKAPATLSWPGLSGQRVELGELQATKWTKLEPLPVGAAGKLTYDAEQALQMIVTATPPQFATAQATVERFATQP
ncbi:MAG: hypothetical protein WCP21_23295, partial [Armatimonadota bacterium]